jgi:AcrR family transcriptional regulator
VTTGTRERILAATIRLLSEEGTHAASIDRIAAEADVATATVYRHFATKDELVAAALDRSSRQCLIRLDRRLDEYGADPVDRFRGLRRTLDEWLAQEGHEGSLIANVAVDLRSVRNHPAWAVIAAHRRALRRSFERLAAAAGLEYPEQRAEELLRFIDAAGVAAIADRRPPDRPPDVQFDAGSAN